MSLPYIYSVFIQATLLISPSDRFPKHINVKCFLSHSEQPFYVHLPAVIITVENGQYDGLTV